MKDTFLVSDLETMKALSDPRRVEILGLLQKPRTIRQVADVLGESSNGMYYHITELEKHGLIEVVKTAMKGHLQEKYYQAVARFYSPAANLFESQFDQFKVASVQLAQTMFEAALGALHRVVANSDMDESLLETGILRQWRLHLTPLHLQELKNRLVAIIEEFGRDHPAADGIPALLTVLFFPTGKESESDPEIPKERQ